MPSITAKLALLFVLLGAVLVAAGCGDSTATATYDPEASVHPPDWLPAKHMQAAGQNAGTCRQCHGEDLVSGGITGIGCNGCHLGGPLAVHPATFEGFPWLQGGHGRYVVANGTTSCRNIWCHGANLQGVAQSGPSCNECHGFP
jgi:hypothetical protein